MAQPNIVRRDKASSHPRERGRFYNGIITSVRSDGRVHVRIPSLNVSYGPIMPLNTTDTSRYVKDDTVLCGFTDENNSQLVIFGSISPKFDVFATAENGISIYENAGSRDAAIPSPTEGRTVYILDTDELQIYNGTEWITVVDTGNSENITAATLVATSASIGTLTVTGASTLNVLGSTNLTASTSIGNVSSTEIGYLDGVTSAIQTQINSKSPTSSPTFTGTVTIPTLSVTSNATIGGNLTVNGTTTTINSTVTTIDDPIITLGGDTSPSSDDNKDRGIEFRYHSGTAASVGFMGYDDSTGRFTFLTGATNSSEVFSGTLGTIDIASIIARPASTQDGIILQGRAGGTSDYAITLTPGTLTASRTITLPDTAGTVVTTGDSGTVTSTMIANDTIVNADINSAAAIADTKLATISTAGKVSNAATTATSANTANAIVTRDASGNFSAGTITAALSGNATTATTASYSTYWWAQSHVGSYYLVNNWDGSRWNLTSNHGAAVRVGYADSAGSVPASGISGQTGMWTSAARPGPYRLYRRDDNSDYSVQTYWTGARWRLYGYQGDSGHADTHVGYADSAGSAPANGGNSSTCGGYSPQSSGFNEGLAVRQAGDARLDSNYFVGYGTVGVATGNSINLRRRSADGYFLIEGSRREYKRDIEYIDWASSRDILLSLKPAKFNWKDEFDGPEHWNPLIQQLRIENKEYGFIVEDVAETSSELVTYLDDNDEKTPKPMMWQQNGVIALLVKTVQELINKVESLEQLVGGNQ